MLNTQEAQRLSRIIKTIEDGKIERALTELKDWENQTAWEFDKMLDDMHRYMSDQEPPF